MKSCAIVVLCALLVVGLVSGMQADSKITASGNVTIFVSDVYHHLLGSETFSFNYTSPWQPTLPEPLSLWFTLGSPSEPGQELFSDIPLVTNVGHRVCIDAACKYPDYQNFVELFTDGTKEPVTGTFTVEATSVPVYSTTQWAWDTSFSGTGTDFSGDRIGKICMQVDGGNVQQVPRFIGVPEPGTWAVIACGFACFAVIWARRRRLAARRSS